MIRLKERIKQLFYTTKYRNEKLFSTFIKKNDLCFDIGANLGKKSELFLSLGATVIAFEPQSACLKTLSEMKRKYQNFQYHQIAVGAKNEKKELFLGSHIEIATLSKKFIRHFTSDKNFWTEKEQISVATLDTLIAKYGLPSFCKIDVEGYEYEIVKELSYKIPIIEFEFTGGFIHETIEILEILSRLGDYQFNYILNEKPKLILKSWLDKNEMVMEIKSLATERLHGNIFAKLIEKPNV